MISRSLVLVLGLAAGFSSCVVVGSKPATPQRPTFSNNTGTTAVGTFETEFGIDDDWQGDRSEGPRTTMVTAKYGLTEFSEIFIAGLPYVEIQTPTGRETGESETRVGMRERIWEAEDGSVSFALQGEVEIPTGSTTDGLSSGETDFYASAILSGDTGLWGWTAFVQHGRVDLPGLDRKGQDAFALAIDTPLDDQFSAFAELAYVRFRGINAHPKFGTAGIAWAQDPALVWDLSVVRRINNDGPGTRVQFGATVNWGRVGGE